MLRDADHGRLSTIMTSMSIVRARSLTPVSRETAARLDRFVAPLLKWQEVTHLIASSRVQNPWPRHIANWLQRLDLAPAAKIWFDVGTGDAAKWGRRRISSIIVCWRPDGAPCRSTTSMMIVRVRSRSRLFHVKQPCGSIASLRCCWNGRRSHLIASSTLQNPWPRHIANWLQRLDLAPAAKIRFDVGTGDAAKCGARSDFIDHCLLAPG
jgi:rRNA small subunit methyltransferase G